MCWLNHKFNYVSLNSIMNSNLHDVQTTLKICFNFLHCFCTTFYAFYTFYTLEMMLLCYHVDIVMICC